MRHLRHCAIHIRAICTSISTNATVIAVLAPLLICRAGRECGTFGPGERARNIRFYEKNEFRPLATVRWNGADVVFMGRLLRPR
jgi:hypothetical protein